MLYGLEPQVPGGVRPCTLCHFDLPPKASSFQLVWPQPLLGHAVQSFEDLLPPAADTCLRDLGCGKEGIAPQGDSGSPCPWASGLWGDW